MEFCNFSHQQILSLEKQFWLIKACKDVSTRTIDTGATQDQ